MSVIAGADELWVAWKRAALALERAHLHGTGVDAAQEQEREAWLALAHCRERLVYPEKAP